MSKPAFRMSASLLNRYLYYKNNPSAKSLDNLARAVNNDWGGNTFTDRGETFEDEVNKGLHGKISDLIKPLNQQVYKKRHLDMGMFDIRIGGKIDAIDYTNSRLYDLKRVGSYDGTSYTDRDTIQHTIYFYLFPEISDFYYILAVGRDSVTEHHVIHHPRPSAEDIENKITSLIKEFFTFLAQKELLQKYQENYSL